jgi:hypothetical protein
MATTTTTTTNGELKMIIELNIGLDVEGQTPKASDHFAREKFALGFLGKHYETAHTVVISEYDGPSGETFERTLVVAVAVPDHGILELEQLVFRLAEALGQDVIAVYSPAHEVGALIGPHPEKWGEFNAEYFKRFQPGV